jgi:hypothetical protein
VHARWPCGQPYRPGPALHAACRGGPRGLEPPSARRRRTGAASRRTHRRGGPGGHWSRSRRRAPGAAEATVLLPYSRHHAGRGDQRRGTGSSHRERRRPDGALPSEWKRARSLVDAFEFVEATHAWAYWLCPVSDKVFLGRNKLILLAR